MDRESKMNDSAIKNFAVWARNQLIEDVGLQMRRWAIDEEGAVAADADTLNGEILSPEQRRQRAELLRQCRSEGSERLMERAAYTWFNRFLAIRFMELRDYLPCGMRFFSAPDGSFESQVLKEALHADIEGVDRLHVAELVGAGDDEALFRYLFIAQCNELAESMPAVFEKVGSAMDLLLPQGLLREGSVIKRMVADIPEDDWREGVEIVGWMYQYYVSERKDEVFASFKKGKKAERDAIAPATQLFTPEWIVRYLVENSLGRLWMLNHPDSHVVDRMDYYIAPDENDHEDFKRISSPEDIAVCDPACGSGHILVYAFDLLALMYEEAGYVKRDIPRLILEKNLSGMEIDPRAAALASFALTMKARELDSRFLRRGVSPDILVLEPAELTEEELDLVPALSGRKKLLDAMAHLDECGSLFDPEEDDVLELQEALQGLEGSNSLFADSARLKIQKMLNACNALSRKFDVVVANPPYMGSKNMNAWLSKWIKANYPDVKSDLFSSFIVRNMEYGTNNAELGFMSPYVWMFIGSYEKLRTKIIDEKTITSLIQLEYSGFAGATVPVCTFTLHNSLIDGYRGGYVRLSDFVGADNQAPRALEAIANPDCCWFYRRNAQDFKSIPGSPIAYWASNGLLNSFKLGKPLSLFGVPRVGLQTGDNARFVREWWEVSLSKERFDCPSIDESIQSGCKWFPYNKGGDYRKWYGNNDCIVNWENDGSEIRSFTDENGKQLSRPQNTNYYFCPAITWSKISSGSIAFRFKPTGHLFDVAGTSIFGSDEALAYLQGACNSSVMMEIASLLSPTLNFEVGQVASYPIIESSEFVLKVSELVSDERMLSKRDWDSNQTSWDYKHHPLIG